MTGFEIVRTIIQFCVLGGLIYSLYLTRREFIIRTRPYIGFSDIVKKDSGKKNELEFDVIVSNVGSLPAKNAKLYGKFIVAGEGETNFECETKGSGFHQGDYRATEVAIRLFGRASCKIPLNLFGVGDKVPCLSVFVATISPKSVKYPAELIYDRTAVNYRAYLHFGAPFGAPEYTPAPGQVRG
ncbi:hypothetical protein ACFLW6_04820 [Chloroflexota bacterium]